MARDPEEDERTAVEAVAPLRLTAARYPTTRAWRRLLDDLRTRQRPSSPACGTRGRWPSARRSRKTVTTPSSGGSPLDCDALHIPDVDQRMIVYSAAPGTSEAEALALLRVVGLQDLEPSAVPDRRPG